MNTNIISISASAWADLQKLLEDEQIPFLKPGNPTPENRANIARFEVQDSSSSLLGLPHHQVWVCEKEIDGSGAVELYIIRVETSLNGEENISFWSYELYLDKARWIMQWRGWCLDGCV